MIKILKFNIVLVLLLSFLLPANVQAIKLWDILTKSKKPRAVNLDKVSTNKAATYKQLQEIISAHKNILDDACKVDMNVDSAVYHAAKNDPTSFGRNESLKFMALSEIFRWNRLTNEKIEKKYPGSDYSCLKEKGTLIADKTSYTYEKDNKLQKVTINDQFLTEIIINDNDYIVTITHNDEKAEFIMPIFDPQNAKFSNFSNYHNIAEAITSYYNTNDTTKEISMIDFIKKFLTDAEFKNQILQEVNKNV